MLLEATDCTELLGSNVVDLNSAACKKSPVNGIFSCLGAHGVAKLSKCLQYKEAVRPSHYDILSYLTSNTTHLHEDICKHIDNTASRHAYGSPAAGCSKQHLDT